MTELIAVLLICVAWAITSIIIKLIERRCKHEWDNPDVTVLKTGNKLSFKCMCGCEFVVSQRYCETELTGEFSFACPECKRKCLHE